MPLFSKQWTPPGGTGASPQILRVRGPALQAQISVPDEVVSVLIKEGTTVPAPVIHTALIDTGATTTCVDETILKNLNLNLIGSSPVSTPQGQTRQDIYPCKISFPGTPIPPLSLNAVLASKLLSFGHGVLIGRDILSQFLLIYNGKEGQWTLAF